MFRIHQPSTNSSPKNINNKQKNFPQKKKTEIRENKQRNNLLSNKVRRETMKLLKTKLPDMESQKDRTSLMLSND